MCAYSIQYTVGGGNTPKEWTAIEQEEEEEEEGQGSMRFVLSRLPYRVERLKGKRSNMTLWEQNNAIITV